MSLQCCHEDEGGPLGVGVQKQAPNYASAAVAQKAMVVSDWRKVGVSRQVRVEQVNESKPTEDASKLFRRCRNRGRNHLAGRAGREICRSTQRQPV
jgi:hypothetical protein